MFLRSKYSARSGKMIALHLDCSVFSQVVEEFIGLIEVSQSCSRSPSLGR